jgi:hypothetical protein
MGGDCRKRLEGSLIIGFWQSGSGTPHVVSCYNGFRKGPFDSNLNRNPRLRPDPAELTRLAGLILLQGQRD